MNSTLGSVVPLAMFINDETNGANAVSFQIKNRISIFACVIFEDASVIN